MNRRVGFVIPLALTALAALQPAAHGASDMFLKIGDIKGEAVDENHEGEIDILAWSWQLSRTGTAQTGGGDRRGQAIVRPLVVTKYIDLASTELYRSTFKGEVIPEAVLTVRKPGETPLEYLKVEMKNVMITSATPGGDTTDDRATEDVALDFSQICLTYTPQEPDGSAGAEETTCWDVEENREF